MVDDGFIAERCEPRCEVVSALNERVRVFKYPKVADPMMPLVDFVLDSSALERKVVLGAQGWHETLAGSGVDRLDLVQAALHLSKIANDRPVEAEQKRHMLATACRALALHDLERILGSLAPDDVRQQGPDRQAATAGLVAVGLQSE